MYGRVHDVLFVIHSLSFLVLKLYSQVHQAAIMMRLEQGQLSLSSLVPSTSLDVAEITRVSQFPTS